MSGEASGAATGEVRVTSSTGGQKGKKPQRYDLLTKPALDAIGEVLNYGAEKYKDPHNWRKGYLWSLSYAAVMRHMTAFWSGETVDPESGLPHLAHAGCHIVFMLTWLSEQGEGGEFDDRYRPEPEIDWLELLPPRMWLTPESPAPEPEFGDYVVIEERNGHQFPLWTRVVLDPRAPSEGRTARYLAIDGTGWWLHDDELRPVS